MFAGRLADAGIDYRPIMRDAIARARTTRNVEIIWASTREVFNVIEADEMACHIITAPAAVLKKPGLGTKNAGELSLDAVKAFRDDAAVGGTDASGRGVARGRVTGWLSRRNSEHEAVEGAEAVANRHRVGAAPCTRPRAARPMMARPALSISATYIIPRK